MSEELKLAITELRENLKNPTMIICGDYILSRDKKAITIKSGTTLIKFSDNEDLWEEGLPGPIKNLICNAWTEFTVPMKENNIEEKEVNVKQESLYQKVKKLSNIKWYRYWSSKG